MQRRCTGALLNVGIDGLACRIGVAEALSLLVDQHVDVAFRLGDVAADFELRARISNITLAGSTEHRVIGLEFVEGKQLCEARAALREAIGRTVDSKG